MNRVSRIARVVLLLAGVFTFLLVRTYDRVRLREAQARYEALENVYRSLQADFAFAADSLALRLPTTEGGARLRYDLMRPSELIYTSDPVLTPAALEERLTTRLEALEKQIAALNAQPTSPLTSTEYSSLIYTTLSDRIGSLENAITDIRRASISRWDVVSTMLILLGALSTLLGVVLTMLRYLRDHPSKPDVGSPRSEARSQS